MSKEKEKGSIGSSLDDFLEEEGISDATNNTAVKRVLSYQLHKAIDCIESLGWDKESRVPKK